MCTIKVRERTNATALHLLQKTKAAHSEISLNPHEQIQHKVLGRCKEKIPRDKAGTPRAKNEAG